MFQRNAYITLLSVLLVGGVTVAIAVAVLAFSLNSSQNSAVTERARTASGLANACAEHALEQIRSDTAYVGSGNLSPGQGSCTYTVTDTGGESRSVSTTGTIGSVVRKVSIVVNAIDPQIIVTSWQETP